MVVTVFGTLLLTFPWMDGLATRSLQDFERVTSIAVFQWLGRSAHLLQRFFLEPSKRGFALGRKAPDYTFRLSWGPNRWKRSNYSDLDSTGPSPQNVADFRESPLISGKSSLVKYYR